MSLRPEYGCRDRDTRRTVRLAALLLATVALGLISRRYPIGLHLYDKSLGDAVYAIAAYLVLALLRPSWPPGPVAIVALTACLIVEFFQLSGIPARHASSPIVRWLLGTRFAGEDIACYLLGVAAIGGLDIGLQKRARRAERTERQA